MEQQQLEQKIFLLCGLRDDNKKEIHTWVPVQKIRGLGAKVKLKEKESGTEKEWEIFGIANVPVQERNLI